MSNFSTDAISSLIEYKWNKLVKIGYVQLLAYILFLLVILMHSTHDDDVIWILPLYVFQALLIIFTTYNLVFGKLKIVDQDPWQLLDILLIA